MEKPLGLEFSNEIRIFEDEMLKWKENFDKRIG